MLLGWALASCLAIRAKLGALVPSCFFRVPVTVATYNLFLLGVTEPSNGPDTDDHVHEERIDARRSMIHFTVRSGTVQSLRLNVCVKCCDGCVERYPGPLAMTGDTCYLLCYACRS